MYNTATPPFSEANLRKAVDLVLDRQEWIEFKSADVIPFAGLSSSSWRAGDFWGHSQEEIDQWPGYRQPKDFDIEEANRLLDELYGAGNRVSMECMARNPSTHLDICLFFEEQMKKYLNIDVDINIMEAAVFNERSSTCEYSVRSDISVSPIYDPTFVYDQYHSGRPDFVCEKKGIDPAIQERVDALIDALDREMDTAKRREISRDLDYTLSQAAHYGTTLGTTGVVYGGQTWLKGVVFPDYGPWASHAWLWERVWLDR